MPYRIKEGQKVLLVGGGHRRPAKPLETKIFNRTVDFDKSELIASPLDEHQKEGVKRSVYTEYPWGFTIKNKWENSGDIVELYAQEVHVIAKGGAPKETKTVVVKGSKSNQYTLTLNEYDEALSCSCPGFRFRRDTCKHIQEWNESLAG